MFACYFKILCDVLKNFLIWSPQLSSSTISFLIARIYIEFGSLHSNEHMAYIQQIFVDTKPTGPLAYLELVLLGTVVNAVMSYTDLPLRVKDLFLQLLYLNLR